MSQFYIGLLIFKARCWAEDKVRLGYSIFIIYFCFNYISKLLVVNFITIFTPLSSTTLCACNNVNHQHTALILSHQLFKMNGNSCCWFQQDVYLYIFVLLSHITLLLVMHYSISIRFLC